MKKLVFIFCFFQLLLSMSFGQTKSVDSFKKEKLLGCWQVKRHFDLPVSSIDDDDIAALSKEKICIKENYITFFGKVIYDPIYKAQLVNVNKYLTLEYGDAVTKKDLCITSDSVYLIHISYNNEDTQVKQTQSRNKLSFFLDKKNLIVEKEGVFFSLVQ